MAEVNLVKFLRAHGFRHDGDHDRGSYWTNGDTKLSVRKSFDKEPGLLRALMDQIRDAERKKERRMKADAEKEAAHAAKVAAQVPEPPNGWPLEAATMSTKGLIGHLIGIGWDNQKIVRALNSQRISHPMGSPWSIQELEEWFPSTKHTVPQTPEEHAEAQVEAARAIEPPAAGVEEVISKKTGKKVMKFTGDERKYVFGRIKAMFDAKMDNISIAKALTSEGLRLPSGKPIDAGYVSTTRNNWKASPESGKKYAAILMPRLAPGKPAPEPPPPRPVVVAAPLPPSVPRSRFNLPLTVDSVLADANVSDDEKLQVLLIFVEVPDSANALLGDHELPVTQKIAVIEAVGRRRQQGKQHGEKEQPGVAPA